MNGVNMHHPIDQLQFGALTPIVQRAAGDVIVSLRTWATGLGLLPGLYGRVVNRSVLLLALVWTIQTEEGLEATEGDVRRILELVMSELKRTNSDDIVRDSGLRDLDVPGQG